MDYINDTIHDSYAADLLDALSDDYHTVDELDEEDKAWRAGCPVTKSSES